LARTCPIIEVGDIADVLQFDRSKEVLKLRVLSCEWELVVAMLIGEAAAVVVFCQHLTDSLKQEIELIERLDAAQNTTVLMIEPDDDPFTGLFMSQAERDAKCLGFQVLYEAIAKRLQEKRVDLLRLTAANAETIAEKVGSRVGSKETGPRTSGQSQQAGPTASPEVPTFREDGR
jgi:hypothetical protein